MRGGPDRRLSQALAPLFGSVLLMLVWLPADRSATDSRWRVHRLAAAVVLASVASATLVPLVIQWLGLPNRYDAAGYIAKGKLPPSSFAIFTCYVLANMVLHGLVVCALEFAARRRRSERALRIAGVAENGIQALRLLDECRPDVVFLEIEMPGATGLDVARQASGRSHVVFVTAYDQHAVAAFDQGAVDHVLKPFSTARLFTAIGRVRQRLATSAPPARLDSIVSSLPGGAAAPRSPLRWINASIGQAMKLITVDEVQYFQADNKYTRVVTRDGEALIRKPLKELVDELDGEQFWQIHRGTVVNAMAVAGVSRD